MTITKASLIDLNGQELILDADADTSITADTDDILDFKTGGTDRLKISGNNLHLNGGTDARIQLSTSGTGNAAVSNNTVNIRGDNDWMKLNAAGNGGFIFEENGTERMRIDSSGNLLIGKTSTGIDVTGFTFDSNGNSNMVCNLTSENESIIYNNNNNSGAKYIHDFRQNGTSVGKIEVGTNSTALVPNSDYRLKENIKTLSNGLDRVKKLKPVQFDWKKDGETSEGFLAHEVQEAGWNVGVTGEKDGERMQGVDYGRMTPLLVKAIQELSAKNDTLEARIKTLEDA